MCKVKAKSLGPLANLLDAARTCKKGAAHAKVALVRNRL